jgi:tetratricopeptide (TPR) repeat protein
MIGKIEKGERHCHRALAQQLDAALGAEGALSRLCTLSRIGTQDTSPPGPRHQERTQSTTTAGSPSEWEDLLAVAQRTRIAAATNVDQTTLDVLRSCCDDIVDRYEAEGPFLVAPSARQLRELLQDLLNGKQHPTQRRALYELAARASGLLAYMAINSGRLPLARAYCSESLQLASLIDDTDLVVWIRGTQSLEAYYAGRYPEAVDFAIAGIQTAPRSPQAIRLLANGAARALAKLGDRNGASEALHRALSLSEEVGAPSGLTSCISFGAYGLARTLANAATAHLSLADVPTVIQYADEVDRYVEEADSAWSRALVSLDVAAALLVQKSPEVEQAMALGHAALAACAERPIRSVVQRGHELARRATGLWHDGPAVREYVEALEQWQAKPAAGILLTDASPSSATIAAKDHTDAVGPNVRSTIVPS